MFKKVILPIIIVVGIIGALVAYKMYHKPHEDINKAATDHQISAADLIESFDTDADGSHAKFNEKTIEISGEVQEVKTEGDHQTVVFDNKTDYVISVQMLAQDDKLSEGASVSIKGFYKGFLPADPDFGVPGEIQINKGVAE